MTPFPFVKGTWLGGMNQFLDLAKIDGENEYYLLTNGRVRQDTVAPIRAPIKVTKGLPSDKLQGSFSIGSYLLVFVGGKAYYKDTRVDSPWEPIVDFLMSPDAETIEIALVPVSFVNWRRIVNDDNESRDFLFERVKATPRAAFVTDGVGQPWLIFPDGSARITRDYNGLETENEYVPSGVHHPLYHDGKLYVVGKDKAGDFTLIFHSVTGQVLNFAILYNPDKPDTTPEDVAGAEALSTAVDYHVITGMFSIPATERAFAVTTSNSTHLIIPDYERLIGAEPTFIRQLVLDIGALNQRSVVNVLGDTTLITPNGIRSFNATSELRNEGRNATFNRPINKLTDGIVQTQGATVAFNNYIGYALDTIYGPGIIWFDEMLGVFVALDLYPGVGKIKQFAVAVFDSKQELYFITDHDVYKAFAGDYLVTCLYPKDFISSTGNIKLARIYANFTGGMETSAHVSLGVYDNKKLTGFMSSAMESAEYSNRENFPYPVVLSGGDSLTYTFDLRDNSRISFRTGFTISWTGSAQLLAVGGELAQHDLRADMNRTYRVIDRVPSNHFAIFSPDGVVGLKTVADIGAFQRQYGSADSGARHTFLALGNASTVTGGYAEWEKLISLNRVMSAVGPFDYDDIERWVSTFQQHPHRYFKRETDFATLWFLSAGKNSSGVPVDDLIPLQKPWLDNSIVGNDFNIALLNGSVTDAGFTYENLARAGVDVLIQPGDEYRVELLAGSLQRITFPPDYYVDITIQPTYTQYALTHIRSFEVKERLTLYRKG